MFASKMTGKTRVRLVKSIIRLDIVRWPAIILSPVLTLRSSLFEAHLSPSFSQPDWMPLGLLGWLNIIKTYTLLESGLLSNNNYFYFSHCSYYVWVFEKMYWNLSYRGRGFLNHLRQFWCYQNQKKILSPPKIGVK